MNSMRIDSDAVSSAANRIGVQLEAIQKEAAMFKAAVDEANAATQGKYPITTTVAELLEKETANFKKVLEAQDDIHASIERYKAKAEESTDVSGLKAAER